VRSAKKADTSVNDRVGLKILKEPSVPHTIFAANKSQSGKRDALLSNVDLKAYGLEKE